MAIRFLEDAAARCLAQGRTKLATADVLARQARVSRAVLLKAVRTLVGKGLLHSRRGSGIFVVRDADRRPPDSSGAYRYQDVARKLASSVAHGEYARGGPLPPAKELAGRFGVSLPTMRRALRELVSNGTVSVERRRYVLPQAVGTTGRPSLLFALPGRPNQVVSPRSDIHEAEMSAVEDVCSRAGIVARRVNCYFDDNPERMVMVPTLTACARPDILGTCLGVVVLARGLRGGTLRELTDFALAHDLPIGILVDDAPPESLVPYRNRPLLKVIIPNKGPSCGEEVGRMLGALGHRHIVYVGPPAEADWNLARLQGLRTGLASCGEPTSVETIETAQMPHAEHRATAAAANAASESVLARVREPGPRYAETRMSMERLFVSVTEGAWLREQANAAIERWRGTPPGTALVGATDQVALACLDALNAHSIRVPGDVSVVGFDDIPEAARCGLTSYSFDSRSCAQAMLNHVLLPPRGPQARHSEPVVCVPGRISVRLSVGRVDG